MDHSRVFEVLKAAFRARGVTYADVAEAVGLSESGVKKIFSAGDTSVARIAQLAEVAGMSLAELFRQADEPPFEAVRITDEDQRWLLDHPDAFRMFWKLTVERAPPRAAREELGLSAAAADKALLQLEARELVRLHPDGRLRATPLLVRWDDAGPLLAELNERWSAGVVRDAAPLRLHELHVAPETAASFRLALAALADDLVRRARYEQLTVPRRQRVTVRLLAALADGGFLAADA